MTAGRLNACGNRPQVDRCPCRRSSGCGGGHRLRLLPLRGRRRRPDACQHEQDEQPRPGRRWAAPRPARAPRRQTPGRLGGGRCPLGGGVHDGCDRHSGGCPYPSSITNPASRSISLGPPFNARRDDRGRPAVPFRIAEDRQGQLRGPFEHAIEGCASVALGRPLAGHEPALPPAKPSRPPSVSRRCPGSSLGLPAVLPPPEEETSVKTAIGAARAKLAREKML